MRKLRVLLSGAAVCALGWSAPGLAQELPIEVVDPEEFDLDSPVVAVDGGEGDYLDFSGSKIPILVTAGRAGDTQLRDYTGAVTVLSAEGLERRQTRNVEDVLRDVPGVAVSSVAGQTQIRLRGSEANHVLILVDGIEVSDPGSGEYDLGTLQAEIGSGIEVLRGPQSALYGNDAIGGVISYGSGSSDGFEGYLEAGTNNTINGAAKLGVNGANVDASLSAVFVTTDGEPNTRAVNGNGVRDIGRDSYTVSGKVAAYVSDTVELRAVARYVETEGDFNDQDFDFTSPTLGLVIDSPGVGFESQAFYGLVGVSLSSSDRAWTNDLSVQFADLSRNTFAPFGLTSNTASDRIKASYVTAYEFPGRRHNLTFAADYELEGFNNIATFDDRRETENVGLVGEYRFAGERFDFSAALRQDFNDRFADTTTFRVGAGFDLTDTTRLRAAAGTGIKNPTFSELFGFFDGVFVGNPDLEPEQSTSWEIGADQRFLDGDAVFSVTYFNAELENEIFSIFGGPPAFTATPANRDTVSTQQGVEVALSAQLGAQWSFNAAYTYVDAEENGTTEVRRPESIASAALTWALPNDAASATLVVRHNGEMLDTDFATFTGVVLDAFTLVNFNVQAELTQGVTLFGRVDNLLDERYEQVFSFVSRGLNAVAGIRASF